MDQITQIPLAQIQPSPFNPRRTFADAGLQELAADIKAIGIHTPVLARPLPDVAAGAFELVYGHRRLRAAAMAGLSEVPCIVRELGDAEARMIQISENLSREDLHPYEEAEGFAALMREHGVSADQLAADTGKSRSYIYGRLKLATLCPEARDAYLAGDFGAEIALLIARLPHAKMQQQALTTVKEQKHYFGRGYRGVRDELVDKFSLSLKDALFDTADALLLPDAGACTDCPKRSGNAPEFEDLALEKDRYGKKGPNLCTDPVCFAAKKAQHLKNRAAELEAKGKTVIDGNKARNAISAQGEVKGDYIALRDVRDAIKNKGAKPTVLTIQDPRTGKTVEAVKRSELVATGVLKKDAPAAKPKNGQQDYEAERKARDERSERFTRRNMNLLRAVREQQDVSQLGLYELRFIVKTALRDVDWGDNAAELAQLLSVERLQSLADQVDALPPDELARLLLDCMMVRDLAHNGWDEKHKPPQHLLDLAGHYGVDTDAAMDGLPTPAPAARAPKKPKAAPAGNKAAKGKAPASEGQEQTDDAGSAGGSDTQAEAPVGDEVAA